MKTNAIGLDLKRSQKVAHGLNILLASYQQLYQNLRGFHWNIQGAKFFELHLKFEELYTDVNLKIDEIAERILALEEKPFHTFSAYQKHSLIPEISNLSEGEEILRTLIAHYKILLLKQREVLESANQAADEGTITLLTDYITQQEKLLWMLRAVLG